MKITVKYADYVNKMDRAFPTVAKSYNPDTKMVTINLHDAFDEHYAVLTMDDDALIAYIRENGSDATLEEARAAVADTVSQMVEDYHKIGYTSVTADAIMAAVAYIK